MLVTDAPEGSAAFTQMLDVPNPIDLIDHGCITVNVVFSDGSEMERDYPLHTTYPHIVDMAVARGDVQAVEIVSVRR